MTAAASDFTTSLECGLHQGLDALKGIAREAGAHSVSVILAENGGALRIVYQWPCDTAAEASERGGEAFAAISAPVAVAAANPIAQILNRTVVPAAGSFLLVPCPGPRLTVVIAFGFASGEPPPVSIGSSSILHLAAMATQATFEVRRLRRDLGVVSERLGRRKIVERAKGLLQTRHGWTEQQAYEHLRKLSRQRRKTMAETAEDLLRMPHAP